MRHELRKRFPRRPWVDVVSKADLPRFGLQEAKAALPDGYLDISTEDGTGLEELKTRWVLLEGTWYLTRLVQSLFTRFDVILSALFSASFLRVMGVGAPRHARVSNTDIARAEMDEESPRALNASCDR